MVVVVIVVVVVVEVGWEEGVKVGFLADAGLCVVAIVSMCSSKKRG